MIEALIAGKLFGKPESRTSKAGKPYVTAKVRCPSGEDAIFVNIIAFSDTVQAAILALDDGEAVALAGTLKPTAWVDKNGNARAGADLIANAVLTVHHAKRKRDAMRQQHGESTASAAHAGDRFDDDGPDPWIDGQSESKP